MPSQPSAPPGRPISRPLMALATVLLAALFAPITLAQPDKSGKGFDLFALPGAEAAPVTVSVEASSTTVRPGTRLALAVTLDHQPGWHSHTSNPAPPASWDFDAIPTVIEVSGPQGLLQGSIQWPEEHVITADLGGTGTPEPYAVYEGKATAFVPLQIPADAAGTVELTVAVGYQACDDTTCDRPQNETFTVSLTVDPDAPAAPAAFSPPFEKFDAAAGYGTLADPTPPATSQTPADAGAGDGNDFTSAASSSLVVAGLLAALGGLVLNLTPCVLPVIPIKVMTLVKHGGESRARTIGLGVWMALGVVAFWLAMGVPMAFISKGLDPSRLLFGNWWVTLAIGLIIALLGVGIMGLFTINLPKAVYAVNPKADSPHGSFLFGVMTAILGLPCFGFVAGGLLVGAATMSALQIMTVFGGLGIGMALPYLVLAVFPSLLDRIPRTGPASELVKQVMGLLMLAGAAFFIAVGLNTLIRERPWLASNMSWWAVALFVAIAGAWLTLRTFQISKKPLPRAFFSLVAIGGTLAFGWVAADFTSHAKTEYLARPTTGHSDEYTAGAWNEYTPARFEKALADGKVVMVDFTADWCINCKAYKRLVLDRDPVLSRTQAQDVVVFEADTTSKTDPANDLMEDLGITGIPHLAIYGPGLDQPLLSNNASAGEVLRRLNQAAGTQPTTSASR
ncbi:MAG: cytochrome c biogenesis protein CcdA [Phycisphaerales bacterium JB041]